MSDTLPIPFAGRISTNIGDQSTLPDETGGMERRRRLAEQRGNRRFAVVHAREHSEQEQVGSPQQSLDNGIESHPYFANRQKYDGYDKNQNPNPPQAGTEARRKFDEEQQKQQDELQNRLGLGMKNSKKFDPRPQ